MPPKWVLGTQNGALYLIWTSPGSFLRHVRPSTYARQPFGAAELAAGDLILLCVRVCMCLHCVQARRDLRSGGADLRVRARPVRMSAE